MSFTSDQIFDRNKLKTQIANWRFFALLALILLLWSLFGNKANISSPSKYIARVQLEGIIMDDHERNLTLKELADDKNVKALIVHINSPGGSFVGGQNVYYALRKIADKKPVVAVMGEIAASGGYMSAIGADHILAREGTLTGSIGILLKSFEITELAERLGVKLQTLKTSIYKASPNPFEKMPLEVKNAVEDTIQDSFEVFFNMVQERRKIESDKLKTIANGRVYTGRQAFEYGLIDALGGEDEAITWLAKDKNIKGLEVVDVSLVKQTSRLEKILDSTATIFSNLKYSANTMVLQ
ncbi:signal peptide peptidase SppA [Holosporaceae bacterium 'Namur']|nr:signal peptide peptidase SppA [Holosporaceae bacterium 'Namur']